MPGPRPPFADRIRSFFRPHLRLSIASCFAALSLVRAAGAESVDFDTYPGGAAVPPGATIGDQWKSLGVIFSDAVGGAVGASNNSCSLTAPNHAYAATIVARFVDPVSGAQALTSYAGTAQDNCWVPGEGIAMRAYGLGGDLLGSIFNSGGGHFEAFSYPTAVIARLEMDCILQGIDNFVFNATTLVDVAGRPNAFRLEPLHNPSLRGRVNVSFSLSAPTAARLELLDVNGRLLTSRAVESLGAGGHTVDLAAGLDLPPGLYLVRLRQGADARVARVVVLD